MQMKKLLFMAIAVIGMAAVLNSCTKDCDHEDGKDGKDGAQGAKGEQGAPGADGKTPTIEICEETGFWIINGVLTNTPATGKTGQDGESGIDGKDGKDGEPGKDGETPTVAISDDGFWVINGEKTNVKAAGTTGPAGPSNTFTLTFVFDGDKPDVRQTVLGGGWAKEPKSTVKEIVPGLYEGNLTGASLFLGWFADGATEPFDFDSPITQSMTLTEKFAQRIESVPVNVVSLAVNYVNANPGAYTLLINEDVDNPGGLSMHVDNVHLTIIGIGKERSINNTGGEHSIIFTLNSATASLTLGNNITLKGRVPDSQAPMINIWGGGSLVMKEGSKITGNNTIYMEGAVYVGGSNSSFIMEGGEISGNKTSSIYVDATGGVLVTNGASFTMSGGAITGNFMDTNVPADVCINSNAGSFTKTGGTIGVLVDLRP